MGNPNIVEVGKATRFGPNNPPKNPGRKKGTVSIVAYLKKIMLQEVEVVDPITKIMEKKTVAEVLALKHTANAMKGDLRSLQDIANRLDGMPIQTQKILGDPIQKVQVNIVNTARNNAGAGDAGDKGDECPREEPQGNDPDNSESGIDPVE